MKNKILTFLNAIDPLFLSKKDKNNFCVAVAEKSPQEIFARSNFKPQNLIFFKNLKKSLPDNNKILKRREFIKNIKKAKIKYYLLPHRCDREISLWAAKNQIDLIAPKAIIQERLENKIYFDQLLKKYNVNSPRTIKNKSELEKYPNHKPLVVQESSSYGFFGTEIFKTKKSFAKKLKNKNVNFKNTLIREFVKGPTVGISIFIDKKGNYFCSSLRLQCFTQKNGLPQTFSGIQWLKTKNLNAKIKSDLEETIKLLAEILKKEKFFGLANFDIILGQKAYVIECNPRLSSATPQLFFWPDLVGNNNAWKALFFALIGKNCIKKSTFKIPNNKTVGSLLDIDVEDKRKIKNILPIGIYEINKKRLKFVEKNILSLKSNKKRFFLYHDLPGKISIKQSTVCTAITNFAIYNYNNGQLNSVGKKIETYLKKQFLG